VSAAPSKHSMKQAAEMHADRAAAAAANDNAHTAADGTAERHSWVKLRGRSHGQG
jgi:hypothetical protein